MTKEQQEVLEKFVEYLNIWWAYDFPDEPNPYTVEKFTVWEPSKGLYGNVTHPITLLFAEGKLLRFFVDDGDEGGGSELTAFYQDSHYTDGPELMWIVHEFDLQPVMMWDNEQGFRKDETREAT